MEKRGVVGEELGSIFSVHLEVSVRPAVWARRRTGAGVGRRACRDMVWRRGLSSAGVENR